MVCNTCKKECGDFYRCFKCNQLYKLQNTTINKCITCKKQCGCYKYCFECNSKKEPNLTDKIELKSNVIEEDNSELNFNFIEDTD